MPDEKTKSVDKKEEEFDAGEFWSWNKGTSLEDFKKCVIDDLSLEFMATAVREKMYGQRFAVNGSLDKSSRTLHVFIYPSLPSTATKEDIQKLEKVFGKGYVVKAGERGALGVVHQESFDIRLRFARSTKNEKLLSILKSPIKMGASCIYTKEGFIFLERSTNNWTISNLCLSARMAAFFSFADVEKWDFDRQTKEFVGREITQEFIYSRGIPETLFKLIILSIQTFLQSLQQDKISCFYKIYDTATSRSVANSKCKSYAAQAYWDKNIRHNKQVFAACLLDTLYVACGLKYEQPYWAWTNLTDEQIIMRTFDVADKNNIILNCNIIPEYYQKKYKTGITALMYAAKKNMENVVKELIKRGSDVTLKDSTGKTARDYAFDPPVVNYLKKVQLSQALITLLKDKEWQKAKDILEDKAELNLTYTDGEHSLAWYIKEAKQESFLPLLQAKFRQEFSENLEKNDFDNIKSLIIEGLSLSSVRDLLQNALIISIKKDHRIAFKNLVALGADIYDLSHEGRSPLSYAEEFHRHSIIQYLKYPSSKELIELSKKGDLEHIKKLVQEKEIDITVSDEHGFNALFYATKNNHTNIIDYLSVLNAAIYFIHHQDDKKYQAVLQSGDLDIEKPIHLGLTSLAMTASLKQNSSLLKITLNELKDTKALDIPLTSSKVTALFLAAKNDNLENCLILLCKGANPSLVLDHPEFKKDVQSPYIQQLLYQWQHSEEFRETIKKYDSNQISLTDIVGILDKSIEHTDENRFENFIWLTQQQNYEIIFYALRKEYQDTIPKEQPARQEKIKHFLKMTYTEFLSDAIQKNNFSKVKKLIEHGANIDSIDIMKIKDLQIKNYLQTIQNSLNAIKPGNEDDDINNLQEFKLNLKSGFFDVTKPISNGLTFLAMVAILPPDSDVCYFLSDILSELKDTSTIDLLLTPSKVTALYLAAKENCVDNCLTLLCAGANLQLVLDHPEYKKEITSPVIQNLFAKWKNRGKMSSGLLRFLDFMDEFMTKETFDHADFRKVVPNAKEKIRDIRTILDELEALPYDPKRYAILINESLNITSNISSNLESLARREEKQRPKQSAFLSIFSPKKPVNRYAEDHAIFIKQIETNLGYEFTVLQQKNIFEEDPSYTRRFKPK